MQFLKLPNPNAKCALRCRAPTASQTQYLALQACSTLYKLVERLLQVRTVTFHVTLHENGRLCGWGVRIWKGGDRELPSAEECRLHLFHNIISWVWNNPPLHIHSFCENWAKCYWTCDPNDEVCSSVLPRQDLLVADSSYQRWYQASSGIPTPWIKKYILYIPWL